MTSQVVRRVVKVLQQHLSREAVVPTVGSVVGRAAVTALARLTVTCGDIHVIAPRCCQMTLIANCMEQPLARLSVCQSVRQSAGHLRGDSLIAHTYRHCRSDAGTHVQ